MAMNSLDDAREYLATCARGASIEVFGEQWVQGQPSEFGLRRHDAPLMVESRMGREWADVTFTNSYDFLLFGNQDGEHPKEIVDDATHMFLRCALGGYSIHKGMFGRRMMSLAAGAAMIY